MCGIAGIIAPSFSAEYLQATAGEMASAMAHRGPDDVGVWKNAQAGVALAHRRLSIIDLSAHGHQPMMSACGRYVLCYNGEIYNYRELRARLNYPWTGESDTEVLLAAIAAWGLEKTLPELRGMFAFALWDCETCTLSLARDRIGEKPLYYGWSKGRFIFASELKSFHALDDFAPNIDRHALDQFMRYSYIGAPYSIYEGIQKLPPGHWTALKDGAVKTHAYYSLTDVALEGAANPLEATNEEAADLLAETLSRAVGEQMVADVPLGAFLSGGIDSSAIVALMQAQSGHPINTFSIGFSEAGFDEAPYAKAVAQHLGTHHTELYVSAEQARNVIPLLPDIYDEPFADSSQIPTYLVSQLAREHVTVSLSGDGGDELFGGYTRYRIGPQIWQWVRWVPLPARRALVHLLLEPGVDALHALLGKESPRMVKIANYVCKLPARDQAHFYRLLCSIGDDAQGYVIGVPPASHAQAEVDLPLPYADWMMLQDALTYLPGDILTKVDRAAMAVSLETRIPFFDPDVMALAWSLPPQMKIREQQGKWLLRQVLYRHVPAALIDRPKAGFAIPVAQWLRGSLREWAGDLLSTERLKRQGYLDANSIAQAWQEHQQGRRDHKTLLWNALMFQSWLARYHP